MESRYAAKVLRYTHMSLALGSLITACLFIPGLSRRRRGYLGAAGAIVIFGSASVPAKHPGASILGTFRFQRLVTAGNSIATLSLALGEYAYLHLSARDGMRVPSLEATLWGSIGAVILTLIQLCAWPAMQRLGAAGGPGIWCGVGMVTSFFWGCVAFSDPVESISKALLAIFVLVLGVGFVAISQTSVPLKMEKLVLRKFGGKISWVSAGQEYEIVLTSDVQGEVKPHHRSEEEEGISLESTMEEECGHSKDGTRTSSLSLAAGLGFAVATGLFDGSLMTAFTAYKSEAGDVPPNVDTIVFEESLALSYLVSFGASLSLLALPLIGIVLRCVPELSSPDRKNAGPPSLVSELQERQQKVPLGTTQAGVATGILWAIGNFSGIHATLGLGQAIGFPLTQVCVLVSAGWGMLGFNEIPHASSRACFGSASLLVLAGAFLLAEQVPP